jgi:hypothetical protein
MNGRPRWSTLQDSVHLQRQLIRERLRLLSQRVAAANQDSAVYQRLDRARQLSARATARQDSAHRQPRSVLEQLRRQLTAQNDTDSLIAVPDSGSQRSRLLRLSQLLSQGNDSVVQQQLLRDRTRVVWLTQQRSNRGRQLLSRGWFTRQSDSADRQALLQEREDCKRNSAS